MTRQVHSRQLLPACAAMLLLACPAGRAEERSARDAFLDRLAGDWVMDGTVQGERATYAARGEWVLQDAWMRLGMTETSEPPKYVANLYVGFDPERGDYVAHWLDGFGAAGARVVGTGRREGTVVTLIFPYAGNPFRDTLQLDADGNSGRLRIEQQTEGGGWQVFAEYVLRRPAEPGTEPR